MGKSSLYIQYCPIFKKNKKPISPDSIIRINLNVFELTLVYKITKDKVSYSTKSAYKITKNKESYRTKSSSL